MTIDDLRYTPFAEHGDASEGLKHWRHRSKVVMNFLGDDVDLKKTKNLDIGAKNAFGSKLLLTQDNTTGDLNEGVNAPSSAYDFVLCSEILEHIMNPLDFMRNIIKLLRPGGYCLISTPLMQWHSGILYQSAHHFIEYRQDRLVRMLKHAGFELVRWRKYLLWDPGFAFWGVRPFLRVLFHRNQLILLRRPVE